VSGVPPTAKMHGYHRRTVRDVPDDGRQVVVHLCVRRLVCPALGCRRQTFREQIPGLCWSERHQRRTVRFAGQISQVAREWYGRAAERLAGLLAVPVSRSTALRHLRRLPLAAAGGPASDRRGRFSPCAAATATPRSLRREFKQSSSYSTGHHHALIPSTGTYQSRGCPAKAVLSSVMQVSPGPSRTIWSLSAPLRLRQPVQDIASSEADHHTVELTHPYRHTRVPNSSWPSPIAG
jgi:hypothetical protein